MPGYSVSFYYGLHFECGPRGTTDLLLSSHRLALRMQRRSISAGEYQWQQLVTRCNDSTSPRDGVGSMEVCQCPQRVRFRNEWVPPNGRSSCAFVPFVLYTVLGNCAYTFQFRWSSVGVTVKEIQI